MQSDLPNSDQGNLFFIPLRELLNPNHPLYLLTDEIDWSGLDEGFSELYADRGRPAHPVRLMVSLLILKQLDNLGDETVVEKWVENPYYQYFSGMDVFQWKKPIAPSDLVHFRNRIGEEGMKLIFKSSIDLHGKDAHENEIVADTTVQEKAITYPTDAKLYKKVIEHSRRITTAHGVKVRQSYVREVPRLMKDQHNAKHPKRRKKARKSLRRLHTIAGRLVREMERKLPVNLLEQYRDQLSLYNKVLTQKRSDKNKIYSIHEPEVCCIAKGKAHPKYEFGSKVSIAKTKTSGIIVAALNFQGNPYDGHTIEPTLDQYESLLNRSPKVLLYDRGGRGRKKIGETEILIPSKPNLTDTIYQKRKARKRFRRRAAIEPIIGHLKSRFGLSRNWLKGIIGDQNNLFLAVAAFNYKKWMNNLPMIAIMILQTGILFGPIKNRLRY